MSLRAQARIMALFAEREETPAPPTLLRHLSVSWQEEWYWDGASHNGANPPYEHCSLMLHRRLHVLKSMTDKQYVQMRKRRCVRPEELESHEFRGVTRSPRGYAIHWAREELRNLEARLRVVVNALPYVAGYAADQDHFHLRRQDGKPWSVNWQFAAYLSFERRVELYKRERQVERAHEERRRDEVRLAKRDEKYPKLLARIRELEKLLEEQTA